MNKIIIRKANENDFDSVFKLIEELKDFYEKKPNDEGKSDHKEFKISKEDFSLSLGKNSLFEIFLAEKENQILGMALYSYCYDSFRGKAMYLDTLVVSTSSRGEGIGKKIIQALIEEALKNKVNTLFWEVSKTNESAIKFYESLRAELTHSHVICRLNKKNMTLFLHDESL